MIDPANSTTEKGTSGEHTSNGSTPSVPATYIAGRIVSSSPLITFSSVNQEAPLGLISVAPELLGDKRGLHFLHSTWTLEQGGADRIAAAIAKARMAFPRSEFVMMAPNEIEAELYSKTGETCIVANTLALTDERLWYPMQPTSDRRFDAVYNALLDSPKRHELAKGINSLQLIYGYSLEDENWKSIARVRSLLPNAHFANNAEGQYRLLSQQEVAARLAQSDVGLCLSAVEGVMPASMEYLLSGMPVVSTHSLGGRDRYFVGNYCRIVDPDPDAIAAAVQELRALRLDRRRIREHVGHLIAFERYNILKAINAVAKETFGSDVVLRDLSGFIGGPAQVNKASQVYDGVLRVFPPPEPRNLANSPSSGARASEPLKTAPVSAREAVSVSTTPPFVVILAMARSGTHLLRSLLGQESWIDCVNEVFNHSTHVQNSRHFARFFAREVSADPHFELSANRAVSVLDGYFRSLQEPHRGTRSILLDVKEETLRILDWPVTGLGDPPRLLSFMLDRQFSVIRMRRRNLLAQLASLQLAIANDEWSRNKGQGGVGLTRIRIEPDDIVAQLSWRLSAEKKLDDWVSAKVPVTTLFYEDLLGPNGGLSSMTRETLGTFLGRDLNPDLLPGTEKLAPPLRRLIANFDEVARRLIGTRFEDFLADDAL